MAVTMLFSSDAMDDLGCELRLASLGGGFDAGRRFDTRGSGAHARLSASVVFSVRLMGMHSILCRPTRSEPHRVVHCNARLGMRRFSFVFFLY